MARSCFNDLWAGLLGRPSGGYFGVLGAGTCVVLDDSCTLWARAMGYAKGLFVGRRFGTLGVRKNLPVCNVLCARPRQPPSRLLLGSPSRGMIGGIAPAGLAPEPGRRYRGVAMQARSPQPRSGRLQLALRGALIALVLLLLAEGALRLMGRPRGRFSSLLSSAAPSGVGPWPAHLDALIESGPIPYRVRTNADGFRGPELRSNEMRARQRIVALGDSFTEGFYVANEQTYPAQLQAALGASGRDVEVINAARGGGSIDRFRQLLEHCVLPLQPDLVLLTFVTNDLADLGWFALEQDSAPNASAPGAEMAKAFVGQTALGEWLLELSLGPADVPVAGARAGASLTIEGGDNYAANSARFMQRYGDTDGRILGRSLAPQEQRAWAIYRHELAAFRETCEAHGIDVFMSYVPAYPEIYVERPSSVARQLVGQACRELGIGFLDLTPVLRQASLGSAGLGPLHLAPLDYHLNARGLAVMARAIGSALGAAGLLPEPEAGE